MLCCPNTRRALAGGLSVAAILLAAVVVFLPRGTAATADEPKVKAEVPAKVDAPKADAPKAGKSDLTCLGGDPSRNMVNLTDKGIPHALGEGEEFKLNEKLLKWNPQGGVDPGQHGRQAVGVGVQRHDHSPTCDPMKDRNRQTFPVKRGADRIS